MDGGDRVCWNPFTFLHGKKRAYSEMIVGEEADEVRIDVAPILLWPREDGCV